MFQYENYKVGRVWEMFHMMLDGSDWTEEMERIPKYHGYRQWQVKGSSFEGSFSEVRCYTSEYCTLSSVALRSELCLTPSVFTLALTELH
jgi:hypothetical protein